MPVVFENMFTLENVKSRFVKYGFYMRLCCFFFSAEGMLALTLRCKHACARS